VTHSNFTALGRSRAAAARACRSKLFRAYPHSDQTIPSKSGRERCPGDRANRHGENRRFGLPLLQMFGKSCSAPCLRPRALILAPTRELAIQIDESCASTDAI